MATGLASDVLRQFWVMAVVGYLFRQALRSPPVLSPAGNFVLIYSPFLEGFSLLGGIVFSGISIFVAIAGWSEPQKPAALAGVSVITMGMVALSIYGALESLFVRIEIRPNGVWSRSPWRETRFIAWNAIASVEFSDGAKWFIIRDHECRTIRASLWLSGIRSLYDSLEVSAPPEAWHARYEPFED